jgi:hypothetical protein
MQQAAAHMAEQGGKLDLEAVEAAMKPTSQASQSSFT